MDIGAIETDISNVGELRSNNGGLIWNPPQRSFPWVIYNQGLNIAGKVSDTVKGILNFWWSPFSPGPIIDGISAIYSPLGDTARYRVYKITRGDTYDGNKDLKEWPIDLGAPADTNGQPRLYGDQTLWMIFNGADRSARNGNPKLQKDSLHTTLPLEIRHVSYSYTKNHPPYPNFFGDIVLFEWEVINKGSQHIDSMYFGFWTDIDFNHGFQTIPAVDTALQLGYCWTPRDTIYNNYDPFTVGYTLLHGPHAASAGENAIIGEKTLANKKNLPISSFHGIGDDSYGDPSYYGYPQSLTTFWNVVRGLYSDGSSIFDSVAGTVTKFPYSGDPVKKDGWLFPVGRAGGGAGFIFFSGPTSMAPLDTQWLMVAMIPTLGVNNLQSIENLRLKTAIVREMSVSELRGNGYNWSTIIEPKSIPLYHDVYQNYPNPFNASTKIPYDIAIDSDVKIEIYNTLGQKVRELVNTRVAAGKHEAIFNADDLPTGVYYCLVKIDYFLLSKKMMLIK